MNKYKITRIHEEYPEHDWIRDENGEIDEWAAENGYHNGPLCKRCYHSFCIYCNPDGYKDTPCIVDEYHCPTCNEHLYKSDEYNFCPICGTPLDWEVD